MIIIILLIVIGICLISDSVKEQTGCGCLGFIVAGVIALAMVFVAMH